MVSDSGIARIITTTSFLREAASSNLLTMITELIFVYNADSGKVNAIFDIAHKIISPKTYNCSLCSLTHGIMSENQQWRDFKNSTNTKMTFLHKDEFESKYKTQYEYPVVLAMNNDEIDIFLAASEINAFTSLNDLIAELISKTS